MATPAGDTHPWGGAGASDASIMRKLLAGAEPVCIDCGRTLERGEPRVTVPPPSPRGAVLLRCADCEYRKVHG